MFNEYDLVIPANSVLRDSLGKDKVGTIVMVYDSPNRAYEVEFSDDSGITIVLKTMTDDELLPYIPSNLPKNEQNR
jgi:hypothetical protein